MMETRLLLILSCVLHISSFTLGEKNTRLLFVQILFRHGDRAPVVLYPTDPNPASFWPEGLGQLTILGRKQQYALGNYLRDRYENFMTSSPLEVKVLSSELDRCLKSAETNIAAFFTPKDEWLFEKSLKWQPIPVYYIPEKTDKYLQVGSFCPRATQEQERVFNLPESQKLLAKHKEMFENLTLHSGKEVNDWLTASSLHDTLHTERQYNLSIPLWALEYWDELEHVVNLSFYWRFNSPLLHRLRGGPLLGKIIENMQKKIRGELPNQKFQIFSGHNTNIAVVLDALNLFNMIEPPYCATLLFELHENMEGVSLVRLLYQNSSAVEKEIQTPHVLTLEGCTEFCPLEYFINYTRHLIPADWNAECKPEHSIAGLFIFLGMILIFLICTYAAWRIYSRRQDFYMSID